MRSHPTRSSSQTITGIFWVFSTDSFNTRTNISNSELLPAQENNNESVLLQHNNESESASGSGNGNGSVELCWNDAAKRRPATNNDGGACLVKANKRASEWVSIKQKLVNIRKCLNWANTAEIENGIYIEQNKYKKKNKETKKQKKKVSVNTKNNSATWALKNVKQN